MTLETQFKLKSNPLYLQYLHENSNWYKILNRSPKRFREFEEEMKERYALRPTDKLNKIINTLDMITAVTNALGK